MRLFPVFSKRITRALERLGFEVVQIGTNTKHPDQPVYYFEETPALRKAVNELTKK